MKKRFEDLYENLTNNTSPDFDEAWRNAKKEQKTTNILFLVLAILVDAFIIYKMNSFISGFGMFIIFLLVFILMADIVIYFLLTLIFSKRQRNFKILFKTNIIRILLSNFYDNIVYTPQTQMPDIIYRKAKYNEYFNQYYSDDYMEGNIDNKYPIKMAEVHTIHETTHTDSDGNTHTTSTTIFHGLFSVIMLDKSINSELQIRANRSIASKTKLEMDSQEFEKNFDVSASNPIIGMQLLTHDIMELLISFKKATGITYDISIYDNVMYLRFHTGALFEINSIKKGAFDKELLKKYYNILDFSYTLSKMLIDLIGKTEI